ncbi:MAG TPA: LysM peptidoglycan-binding domain-containing protein [Planktothrix sp.]
MVDDRLGAVDFARLQNETQPGLAPAQDVVDHHQSTDSESAQSLNLTVVATGSPRALVTGKLGTPRSHDALPYVSVSEHPALDEGEGEAGEEPDGQLFTITPKEKPHAFVEQLRNITADPTASSSSTTVADLGAGLSNRTYFSDRSWLKVSSQPDPPIGQFSLASTIEPLSMSAAINVDANSVSQTETVVSAPSAAPGAVVDQATPPAGATSNTGDGTAQVAFVPPAASTEATSLPLISTTLTASGGGAGDSPTLGSVTDGTSATPPPAAAEAALPKKAVEDANAKSFVPPAAADNSAALPVITATLSPGAENGNKTAQLSTVVDGTTVTSASNKTQTASVDQQNALVSAKPFVPPAPAAVADVSSLPLMTATIGVPNDGNGVAKLGSVTDATTMQGTTGTFETTVVEQPVSVASVVKPFVPPPTENDGANVPLMTATLTPSNDGNHVAKLSTVNDYTTIPAQSSAVETPVVEQQQVQVAGSVVKPFVPPPVGSDGVNVPLMTATLTPSNEGSHVAKLSTVCDYTTIPAQPSAVETPVVEQQQVQVANVVKPFVPPTPGNDGANVPLMTATLTPSGDGGHVAKLSTVSDYTTIPAQSSAVETPVVEQQQVQVASSVVKPFVPPPVGSDGVNVPLMTATLTPSGDGDHVAKLSTVSDYTTIPAQSSAVETPVVEQQQVQVANVVKPFVPPTPGNDGANVPLMTATLTPSGDGNHVAKLSTLSDYTTIPAQSSAVETPVVEQQQVQVANVVKPFVPPPASTEGANSLMTVAFAGPNDGSNVSQLGTITDKLAKPPSYSNAETPVVEQQVQVASGKPFVPPALSSDGSAPTLITASLNQTSPESHATLSKVDMPSELASNFSPVINSDANSRQTIGQPLTDQSQIAFNSSVPVSNAEASTAVITVKLVPSSTGDGSSTLAKISAPSDLLAANVGADVNSATKQVDGVRQESGLTSIASAAPQDNAASSGATAADKLKQLINQQSTDQTAGSAASQSLAKLISQASVGPSDKSVVPSDGPSISYSQITSDSKSLAVPLAGDNRAQAQTAAANLTASTADAKIVNQNVTVGSTDSKSIVQVGSGAATDKVGAQVPIAATTDTKVGAQVPIAASSDTKVGAQVPIAATTDTKVGVQVPIAASTDTKVVAQVPITASTDTKVVAQVPIAASTETKVGAQVPIAASTDTKVVAQVPITASTETKVGAQVAIIAPTDIKVGTTVVSTTQTDTKAIIQTATGAASDIKVGLLPGAIASGTHTDSALVTDIRGAIPSASGAPVDVKGIVIGSAPSASDIKAPISVATIIGADGKIGIATAGGAVADAKVPPIATATIADVRVVGPGAPDVKPITATTVPDTKGFVPVPANIGTEPPIDGRVNFDPTTDRFILEIKRTVRLGEAGVAIGNRIGGKSESLTTKPIKKRQPPKVEPAVDEPSASNKGGGTGGGAAPANKSSACAGGLGPSVGPVSALPQAAPMPTQPAPTNNVSSDPSQTGQNHNQTNGAALPNLELVDGHPQIGSQHATAHTHQASDPGILSELRRDDETKLQAGHARTDRTYPPIKSIRHLDNETISGPASKQHFDNETISGPASKQHFDSDTLSGFTSKQHFDNESLSGTTSQEHFDDAILSGATSKQRFDDETLTADETVSVPSSNGHPDDETISEVTSRRFENEIALNQNDDSVSQLDHDSKKLRDNEGELSEILRMFGEESFAGVRRNNEIERFERRRIYSVKQGDTLVGIARRELGHGALVELLIELNRGLLEVDEDGNFIIKPGAKLRLPSRADKIRFLAQAERNDAPEVHLPGSRDDARSEYACRLGDSLRSIARRHPNIKDERLHELLAIVNKLPIKQSKNGQKLKRGQRLIIPSVRECQEYLQQRERELADSAPRTQTQVSAPYAQVAAPHTHAPTQISIPLTQVSAALENAEGDDCTRSVAQMPRPDSPPEPKSGLALHEAAALTNAKLQSSDGPIKRRLISQADLGDGSSPLALRLELDHGGRWSPIIEYEITDTTAFVKVYTAAGRQRQTAIDLPTRAARELAENDLAANCEAYCHQYLNNRFAF